MRACLAIGVSDGCEERRLPSSAVFDTCIQDKGILLDPRGYRGGTSGGSAGHNVEALRRFLPHKDALPGRVLLWVVDPAAAASARKGARLFRTGHPVVEWCGTILFTCEGQYRARGKTYTGQPIQMGEAAVIESGRLQVAVCSYLALVTDPAFFECVGLEPDSALAVLAKSIAICMAGYDAEWECGLLFDGPGSTTLDLDSLPFEGSARGLFPINLQP